VLGLCSHDLSNDLSVILALVQPTAARKQRFGIGLDVGHQDLLQEPSSTHSLAIMTHADLVESSHVLALDGEDIGSSSLEICLLRWDI